ncbi:hypothetical protein DKX38_025415 [Salix brachista]|uniref:DUF1421 domain-containing protein n=1 Tax=Salix brachista TaxID=2182728 RepID=A0A5N5JQU0_9ROSI|nr:hypothetical protein DKX38_025415 [Salix brachista]
MSSSQFMDKQIMDLTSSSSTAQSLALSSSPKTINSSRSKDFIDLMNPPPPPPPQDDSQSHNNNDDDLDDGIKREEIVASYDFQPIRPVFDPTAADSKSISSSASPLRNYGSLDSIEPAKVVVEKDRNVFDAASIISEIDRTMNKFSDNLLHALEGVSARLTQLESRTRHLENSVDDLKMSVGNNHESTQGNMIHLHNILREVQTGVQVLKDKQEMLESQLQLTKLQVSKADQQKLETQFTGQMDAVQQGASAPQSHQLPPLTFPQSVPPVSLPPSVPPPIPQQNLSPPALLSNQFPQNQIPPVPQKDPYYSPPGQPQEPPKPQYQVPSSQQLQPPPAAPPLQPYHSPQLQYSQPHQPQPPPSLTHNPEETPFIPHQSYPPSLRPLSTQPPSGAPPPQPYYGAPSNMYEAPISRPSSGFSAGYGPPSGPTEPYPYGGSPTQYVSSPTMKQQQPAVSQSGGSGYPQLPTARILPQALPTASGIGSGSGSSGTGNRVPLDDVVDKVTNMGFPREHVRDTVQKLTENGQAVDLNVVLDKLMNGGYVQPQRGWFGR